MRRRRVRTPTILAMERTESGAAALGMVLAHHDRWVPLEELRVACGVSRDGSSAAHLIEAAAAYGLAAEGRRVELEELEALPLPAVLFWSFDHFVVLEGVGPRGLRLNDPSRGSRPASWEEADRAFTGVALTFTPTEAFTPGGAPMSVRRALASRMRGATSPLVLCILAGIGLLVPGLLVPVVIQIFVNEVLDGGDTSWIAPILIGAGLAAIVSFALAWLQHLTLLRLAMKLSTSMTVRFFEHVLRLPLAFFGQRYAGDVVGRINLNDEVASVLSSELAATVLTLATSVFYLVLMALYDWQVTIAVALLSLAGLIGLRVAARRQHDLSLLIMTDGGDLDGSFAAGLENIETIKATSSEPAFFERWTGHQADLSASIQERGSRDALTASIPVLTTGLTTAAVLGIGGWQVMQGDLSIGALAAMQVLAAEFTRPIAELVGFGQVVQETVGGLTVLDDVVRHPEAPQPAERPHLPADRRRQGRRAGSLELVDVAFGYNPLDEPLIDGLSLSIAPGQRVALIGPTGSGKSTVAGLVAGLLDPWRGTILVDGVPREEIPRHDLATTLAFVDQEIRLFAATVRENLTLFDATLPEEAIVQAARDAQIHDDIVRRPGGYERLLEEGGRDWSGGQRQRLEIARALAVEPELIVLDEATSALDPQTEREIERSLRRRGCSVLMVAHRLSTIRDCDEIIVLDGGRVVQRGRHEDLIDADGVYRDLVLEPV